MYIAGERKKRGGGMGWGGEKGREGEERGEGGRSGIACCASPMLNCPISQG